MNIAFLIGCAYYDDDQISPLKFPHIDEREFSAVLAASCGMSSDEVVLLCSDSEQKRKPTRNNIIRELTSIRSRVGVLVSRIDNLFFFFSGHGFHSSKHNADYLIPQDGVASSLEESSLRLDSLIGNLNEWGAKHTLVFLDVCRAVITAGKGAAEFPPVQGSPIDAQGTATFWSCSPGQRSYESESFGKGVFTFAICKGLSHVGKCKTVYELDRFLIETVPKLSRDAGLPIQNPFSRIEPLWLQDTVLISERIFNEWQELGPLGQEIRANEVTSRPERFSPSEPICGIDFGTSHSAITIADKDGHPVFIPSPENRSLVPSVVGILSDLDYVVGRRAIEYGQLHPESTFYNVKRSLGTPKVFNAAGRAFSAEYLASLIIRSLKMNAEQYIGRRIKRVMVSAPANFTIQQCNALLKACHMAGLSVFRLVGEPSAAAVIVAGEFVEARADYDSFFVLDLGGGTFDVSVIEVGQGVWEIKSAGGDRNLGGVDYDEALFRYIKSNRRKQVEGLPAWRSRAGADAPRSGTGQSRAI